MRDVLARGIKAGRPIGAKRACQYAGRIYRWALAWKTVTTDPFAGINYDDLLGGSEEPRERTLTEDEVARLWRAAEAEGGVFGSLARLYLLPAARRQELADMKWTDIVQVYDEAHQEHMTALAIGTTKNGKPHHLPLSAKALEIINAMPREAERVFPMTTRPGWPYHMARLLKAAQIEERATWHDLRRTASTMLASIGTDDLIRELILAHTLPGKLRRTYVTYRYLKPQLDALEALATKIASIAAGGLRVVPCAGRLTDSERGRYRRRIRAGPGGALTPPGPWLAVEQPRCEPTMSLNPPRWRVPVSCARGSAQPASCTRRATSPRPHTSCSPPSSSSRPSWTPIRKPAAPRSASR